jgi:hypothetical protein
VDLGGSVQMYGPFSLANKVGLEFSFGFGSLFIYFYNFLLKSVDFDVHTQFCMLTSQFETGQMLFMVPLRASVRELQKIVFKILIWFILKNMKVNFF